MTNLMFALKGTRFDCIIKMHQLDAMPARLKTHDFCRSSQSGAIIGFSSSSHKISTSKGTAWNKRYI
jgi:hypothetical protein